MKRSHLARDIVEIAVITILIFVAIRFTIQSYHVDGDSMQPGLQTNEYVTVNKVAYLFHAPERGDVIVFHYPVNPTKDFIKRIIGLPGDIVQTDNTHVTVNGTLLNEKEYIQSPDNPQGNTWTVPKNQYFVMGDNRPVSDDSRVWGFVPRDYIVGKAVIVFWPLTRFKFINTYAPVYQHVKGK